MPRKPRAEYEIVADDNSKAGWRSALREADSAGKKLTGIMKAAFAGISLTAISGAIRSAFQLGDEIGKAAAKAGIAATEMSELAFAARMADVEISGLSTALRMMQVNMSKASTGGKEQIETLDALGLTLAEIKGLAADRQFELIADRISMLKDPADRARAATQLFGRAGADLLPMFEQGAAGIRKAREEAQRLGIALSEETVKALQEGDDALKRLGAAWDAFKAKLAVGSVRLAEALDILDKDELGELNDQLAAAKRELAQATMPPDGGPFDPETYRRAAEAVDRLEHRIEMVQTRFLRGTGPHSGGIAPRREPPGFTPKVDIEIPGGWTDEMRAAIRAAEEWRALGDSADRGAGNALVEMNKDIEQSFRDLPEPIMELGESLLNADEISRQVTRNMFDAFSDVFMSIGDGADEAADQLISAFRRILADQATLQLFKLLGISSDGSSISGFLGTLFGLGGSGGNGLDLADSFFPIYADTGIKRVPRDNQPFLLHKDEAVIPAGMNPWAGGSMGGGMHVEINNTVDARGATVDAIKALPEVLRRNNDQLEARIVTRLHNGYYGARRG